MSDQSEPVLSMDDPVCPDCGHVIDLDAKGYCQHSEEKTCGHIRSVICGHNCLTDQHGIMPVTIEVGGAQ